MAKQISSKGRARFEVGLWALVAAPILLVAIVGMFPTLLVAAAFAAVLSAAGGMVFMLDFGKALQGARYARRWDSAEDIAGAQGRRAMVKPKFGRVEAVLVGIAGILIAFELGAIQIGLGPQFTVVSLGYFLATGAGYLIYRHATAGANVVLQAEGQSPAMVAAPGAIGTTDRSVARSSDLLRALTDQQAEEVLALARWEWVPAGTPLAKEAAQGEWVYIIVNGMVQLTGRSGIGELTVRIAGAGEAFPLAALLGEGLLVTSATAMTDMTVAAISRWRLLSLCTDNPEMGMRLFAIIADLLATRYRSTLSRHLSGLGDVLRQPDVWANV